MQCLFFFSNSSKLVVGGFVFGISKTDVMPPMTAALLPELRSSVSVEPGSLKWTCVSIQPGRTVKFSASKVSFDSSSKSPIFTILPCLIPISCFSSFPLIKQLPFIIFKSNIILKILLYYKI